MPILVPGARCGTVSIHLLRNAGKNQIIALIRKYSTGNDSLVMDAHYQTIREKCFLLMNLKIICTHFKRRMAKYCYETYKTNKLPNRNSMPLCSVYFSFFWRQGKNNIINSAIKHHCVIKQQLFINGKMPSKILHQRFFSSNAKYNNKLH